MGLFSKKEEKNASPNKEKILKHIDSLSEEELAALASEIGGEEEVTTPAVDNTNETENTEEAAIVNEEEKVDDQSANLEETTSEETAAVEETKSGTTEEVIAEAPVSREEFNEITSRLSEMETKHEALLRNLEKGSMGVKAIPDDDENGPEMSQSEIAYKKKAGYIK